LARAFLRDKATPEDRRKVVKHLLGVCTACRKKVARIAQAEGLFHRRDQEPLEYTVPTPLMFPEAESFATALSKVQGLAQWWVLESLSPARRLELVESDTAFHHYGLYSRLLEVAEVVGRTEPQEAEDIALLALTLAPRIKLVTDRFREDLVAGAYGVLGNARRLKADYAAAQAAYTAAWQQVESGSGDPMVAARLQQYEASWFLDLGKYEEAEQLLELALQAYRAINDEHREGRTVLKLGTVRMKYDPQSAIVLFLQAETLYDPAEEPLLELCVRFNCAWCLNDLDRPEEALSLLEETRPLMKRFNDAWVRLRGYWLEARIAFALRRYEDSAEILKSLWTQVQAEGGHPIDLTLISVDLAQVLAERGEVVECVRLIEQLIPILRNMGLHDEGLAVWLLVARRLQEAGAVKSTVWGQLGDYFGRYFRVPVHFKGDLQ
jgi:tetratricopeptide (TPR) repeat protein